MTCQVLVSKEDDWFVATDVASNVASQGHDISSALDNLREALELYYEDIEEIPENSPAFFTTLEVNIHAL